MRSHKHRELLLSAIVIATICIIAIRAVSATAGVRGDVNGDGRIDLLDVCASLQSLAGMAPILQFTPHADINGDGKIGMEEALHSMQVTAGLRTATVILSGRVVVAPVTGATVSAYAVSDSIKVIASTTTEAGGNFTLTLPLTAEPVILAATGGTYQDVATQVSTSLSLILRAALLAINGIQSVAITPVTEAAVQYAASADGGLTAANITTAHSAAQTFLYGIDPIATLPADPTDGAAMFSAADQQKIYSAALGVISQFLQNNSGQYSGMGSLLSWQAPVPIPATKPTTLPNAFFSNNCQGVYTSGVTSPTRTVFS